MNPLNKNISRRILRVILLVSPVTQLLGLNLLTNGDFESGLTGWSLLAQNGSVANYTADNNSIEGTTALKAEVITLGPSSWSIQAISSPWSAQTDRDYTITFWARANTAGSRFRILIQDQSYGNQVSRDQTLSTTWTHYSWTVSPGDPSMDFVIHFFETGTFWIDDIQIDDGEIVLPPASLILDASQVHQTIVGFGGALTWYADRVFQSAYTEEINQLLFEDLGLDIVRFQNWYFPNDYPNNKDTAGMPNQPIWENTATFFQLAKATNPNIKVLLSSWGPPAALKSNDSTAGGTLKKIDGEFVYDQYAQYWIDTFDHLQFIPDYLSIQNEPGYTATWTSCVWRPSETIDFPGYDTAIDAVYNALKDRPEVPLLIGAEVENIGSTSWDGNLNIFREFSTPLKTRDHISAYAYHLYNIWNPGKIDSVIPNMNIIRQEFSDKPNFMTEYSRDFAGWLETARIIQNTLIEANTSAYIHWNMVWGPAENPDQESAMISITSGGSYQVEENYYALKHFSKFIDIGFRRIALQGSDTTLRASAFLSPNGRRLVMIVVNAASDERPVEWDLQGVNITSAHAIQSTEGSLYVELGDIDMSTQSSMPGESLTTYVLDLNEPIGPPLDSIILQETVVSSGTGPISLSIENVEDFSLDLWKAHDLKTWIKVDDAQIISGEETTILTDLNPGVFPVYYQIRASY